MAAIQMSFSGIGRPFSFRRFFISPYRLAVSVLHIRTVLLMANSSMRAWFCRGLDDLYAPKYNSPTAMHGTNTSDALAMRLWSLGSLEKRAMIMFVSRRNLPFTDVHLLAVFFDGL